MVLRQLLTAGPSNGSHMQSRRVQIDERPGRQLSCWLKRGNLAARPPHATPGKKMNTRTQTFSVIIPTRDRASVFVTALKSVLAQQYRDFEVIVVDDGSSIEQNRIYRK